MDNENHDNANAFLQAGEEGFKQALSAARQLAPTAGNSILVGLSGGIDSTALLIMLNSLKDKMRFKLFALHVNHHVRDDSDKDEKFCLELCQKLGVPLQVEHLNFSPDSSQISEEKLREARYERLQRYAGENHIQLVATAHIKDDQIETLLFRLFRGTGRPGLVGMPMARKLADNVVLIRPLLNIARSQCVSYLKELGQEACDDSSNSNVAYRRNFIRHRVIPVIKEQFSSFVESMERFRSLNEEEEAFIAAAVESAMSSLSTDDLHSWQSPLFLQLPIAIQRRVLWQGLKFRDIEPSFERIESCRQAINEESAVSLNDKWDLRASEANISWVDKSKRQKSPQDPWQVELKIPGLTLLAPLNHALKIEELAQRVDTYPLSSDLSAVADLSKAKLPLVIRTREAGDTIQPFGMQEMVQLKKYLHNHKPDIEREAFNNIVMADQEEVLWVPGIGLSNKLRVTDKPSHLLTWLKLAADSAIC